MIINRFSSIAAVAALVFGWATAAQAEVRLPHVFGDHMVLQRDMKVPVWGWADPGEKVAVTIGKQTAKTVADANGKWKLALEPLAAGGPLTMTVEGENTVKLTDVLVGEVWLCSGQSNMAMTVNRCKDFEQEKATANCPEIRMAKVANRFAKELKDDCEAKWIVCSSETVGSFSATAYFFARELNKELGVPVGLINSSWGGSPVEAWTSMTVQAALQDIQPVLKKWRTRAAEFDPAKAQAAYEAALERWQQAVNKAKAAGKEPPRKPRAPEDPGNSFRAPSVLYNAMIYPLAPYAIRGAIWYQGEHNAGDENARLYGEQLEAMVANWRVLWKQGPFPFYYVQLPNFKAPQQQPSQPDGWVVVQEQMLKSLRIANVGMAVTIDLGEARDIHPKNKQDVGKRLALWALAKTYGKDLVHCGPIYKSMSQQGDKIRIEFDHTGGGLAARDGGPLEGFAIAGSDKNFVWAEAKIDGPSVVVSSAEVPNPVAVRYSWAANPKGNLINREGLPASPFRTDAW